jgi:hypothetical protein
MPPEGYEHPPVDPTIDPDMALKLAQEDKNFLDFLVGYVQAALLNNPVAVQHRLSEIENATERIAQLTAQIMKEPHERYPEIGEQINHEASLIKVCVQDV